MGLLTDIVIVKYCKIQFINCDIHIYATYKPYEKFKTNHIHFIIWKHII